MAPTWISLLVTVAMAMTLTLPSEVTCDVSDEAPKYTTVPPEKQAELEMLESLDDSSGEVDPDLDIKANKTTPKIETTVESDAVQDTEAVGGVITSEESLETTTAQDEGSGDVDSFETQFPSDVKHALNETEDEEFIPASDGTTAATTEEVFAPVLVNRKPAQSRPEEPQTTSTTTEETKVVNTDTSPTKNDSAVVVPADAPELKSKLMNSHDVNEEEAQPASTDSPTQDNPSAQATTGDQPLSRGVIVGIVIIGVIVLIALIVLLVYLLVFRPRRKSLEHSVDDDLPPKENGQVANGAPKNNEESMTAFVKELKDNKLSSGKEKTYGTELKDDMEDVHLNGKSDSPV